MANNSQFQSDFDDIFRTSSIKKKISLNHSESGDTTLSQTFSKNDTTSSKSLKKQTETGTKIFVGKKITNSFDISQKKKNKDTTTLAGVSIDTDFLITNKNKQPAKDISRTSIDTGSYQKTESDYQISNRPIIIEEEPEVPSKPANSSTVQMQRKDKAVHSSNISLDISSEFFSIGLPSVNKREALGSGVVDGILGSGGMAKVYKVWNEKLEIFRAVKLLIPTNQQSSWERFRTEAKISAKLKHTNIIEIHDTGEWHGLPYIEMELVDGIALNALITNFAALPSIVCSAVSTQIARALAYAHNRELMIYGKTYKGIIHRDLKPSNIMIGNDGIVKLMDFGVARPIETGLHTIETENVVGTMPYFSPEQINGYPIDQLTDIYSFGAVFYEMLCGQNPFPQVNMVDIVQAKSKNHFKRLEDFHMLMDPRLVSIAQTCLRTDKQDRFRSSLIVLNYMEEIHRSYNCGSPEDVITEFLKDPNKIFAENKSIITQTIQKVKMIHP